MKTKKINRRNFLYNTAMAGATLAVPGLMSIAKNADGANHPNFIVIFCDDMGYGDLGCFGSEKHRTPHIDKMAEEGLRLTSFYVTSGVCTPSRSSLLSGSYPRRTNMHMDENNLCVLFPVAKKGMNPYEITIAEFLKKQGYSTACIGKWHLGDQYQFLPTRQGFDYYYGIPYSNDMGGKNENSRRPPLPLLRNETVIEAPVDQDTITKRYTEEAIGFIKKNKDNPFFVYLPHSMPHNPVHASDAFRDQSDNGRYGDAIEEIDWSTGQILKTLKELEIDENTLVIFTSDNGASSRFGGSNLPLSGWKGSTDEGGMRVPCVMRWPGKIPAGTTCSELSTTMDLLPTFASLAQSKAPSDRVIDGKNIWPMLSNPQHAKSPHDAFYYYQMDQLQAVRSGKWKLHLPLESKKRNWGDPIGKVDMKLYNLEEDIKESKDLSARHPDVVKRLMKLADEAKKDLGNLDQQGIHQRTAGCVVSPKPLLLEK